MCMQKWNNHMMNAYPNRLTVSLFNQDHHKMTKEERERSRTREKQAFTNLYVEKLPVTFDTQDVYNLFSKYGTVLDVKIKKPNTNVPLRSINLLPCAAYVNFKEQTQAKSAMEALNGKSIIEGGQTIRIDYYQRANKFLGGMRGLDRTELINNTHFRVLFIKGIHKNVSTP